MRIFRRASDARSFKCSHGMVTFALPGPVCLRPAPATIWMALPDQPHPARRPAGPRVELLACRAGENSRNCWRYGSKKQVRQTSAGKFSIPEISNKALTKMVSFVISVQLETGIATTQDT